MSRLVDNEVPGESRGHKPRHAQPESYAVLLAKIEELEAYTHTVLRQYPRMERHLLCHDIRRTLANMASQDIVSAARLPILTKSFLAYAKHCSAYRTTTKILEDINYKGATTCRSTIMC